MVTKKAPTPSKAKAMKKEGSQKATGEEATERTGLHVQLGLTFPVTRIQRYMKERGVAQRVSVKAAIAVASTLELLCSEVMELAGENLTEEGAYQRIKPRHLTLAIRADEELAEILGMTTHIAMGGVIPYIEPEIEYAAKPRRKKRSKDDGDEDDENEEAANSDAEEEEE